MSLTLNYLATFEKWLVIILIVGEASSLQSPSSAAAQSHAADEYESSTYRSYRNVRYLRKFAAMFMLSENEISKGLLFLQNKIEKERKSYKEKKTKLEQLEVERKEKEMQRERTLSTTNSCREKLESEIILDAIMNPLNQQDTSAIIDENEEAFEITDEDRIHIKN